MTMAELTALHFQVPAAEDSEFMPAQAANSTQAASSAEKAAAGHIFLVSFMSRI
jgi:hypothetical protein